MAVAAAEEGLAAGEMPIGAVVLYGDEVVGRSYTQESAQMRRLVHADLLALEQADRVLGFGPRSGPLTLAVNLEPCLMCLGAAITVQVDRVWFGLRSPDDGGVDLLRQWRPRHELPFFKAPDEIVGDLLDDEVREQFRRYGDDPSRPAGMRTWCVGLGGP